MRLRAATLLSFGLAVIGLSGCAGLLQPSLRSTETVAPDSSLPMTQQRMELLFASQVDAILGPPGAIQTRVDGFSVYLFSNPERDRMRIVAQIALIEKANPRLSWVLLRANYHSTLDARYAISNGVVYSAFLHPISSLSPDLLESALDQVLSLARTFGSTFSSGKLRFGTPPAKGR